MGRCLHYESGREVAALQSINRAVHQNRNAAVDQYALGLAAQQNAGNALACDAMQIRIAVTLLRLLDDGLIDGDIRYPHRLAGHALSAMSRAACNT
jgi:hypothetical protein